jgi:hypothetical protein
VIVNTARRGLVWVLAWSGYWLQAAGERLQDFAWSIERWDQP